MHRSTVTLQAVLAIVPSMIVGAVALIGASIIAIYGLPFESKTSADETAKQLSQTASLLNRTVDQVNTLAVNQAVTQEAIKTLSNQQLQLDDLRKVVEQHAIHIERQDGQIEALEADSKAESSIRAARGVRR